MNPDFFREIYEYDCWARDRLLRAADGLSAEEFARPNGFVYDGLRTVFAHLLGAQSIYLQRWQGIDPVVRLLPEEVPDLATLKQRWQQHEAAQRAYMAGLTDAGLQREIVSRRPTGEEFKRLLWQDIFGILNHSMQHRSEAAEALTRIGRSPGNMDYQVYLQEKAVSKGRSGLNA